MIVGITFTASYIIYFKFIRPDLSSEEHWWFGVSPEGIGTIGMVINFAISAVIAAITPRPPKHIVQLVERIRIPRGSGQEHEISA